MILECVVTGVAGLFLGFVSGRVTKGMYTKKNKKKEVPFPRLIIPPIEQEYPYVQRIETKTNTPVAPCDLTFPSVPVQPLPVPKNTPNSILFTGCQQNI